jgi:hypothetical protein
VSIAPQQDAPAACCDSGEAETQPVESCTDSACPCLLCVPVVFEGANPQTLTVRHLADTLRSPRAQACRPGMPRLIERPPQFA